MLVYLYRELSAHYFRKRKVGWIILEEFLKSGFGRCKSSRTTPIGVRGKQLFLVSAATVDCALVLPASRTRLTQIHCRTAHLPKLCETAHLARSLWKGIATFPSVLSWLQVSEQRTYIKGETQESLLQPTQNPDRELFNFPYVFL